MGPVIIGYRLEPSERYASKAPAPEGEDKKKAAARASFDMAYGKGTGQVAAVYAVAPEHRSVFSAARGEEPQTSVAVEFLNWLLSLYPYAYDYTPAPSWDPKGDKLCLFGFEISSFCRVCGVEAVQHGKLTPVGFWYGNRNAFDPYDMLTETDQRKVQTMADICDVHGVQMPPQWQPNVDVKADARIVAELVFRGQLYDASPGVKTFTEEQLPTPKIAAEETDAEEASVPAETADSELIPS